MENTTLDENAEPIHFKKIVVVGNEDCGKTQLIRAFIEVSDSHVSAQYFRDNAHSNIDIDGTNFSLLICKAPCPQNHKGERSKLYENADVVIICFAVDNMNSFLCVASKWLREMHENRPDVPLVLVGNKCDLKSQEAAPSTISYDNGLLTARNINAYQYVECSANTKERVLEVFIAAVKATLE
ncbi:ras-like GTP-binding protein RHO [Parasteatoda tepidariorum]|uniref:ras-like GTP-binding protein RHO n=1 Tax=Parasteatoda tepidariorum TaxID=114398 RepID=UPI00077F8D38|nr:ras-like GTP-binding protein RHO [Parasteatoda tepidariorum]